MSFRAIACCYLGAEATIPQQTAQMLGRAVEFGSSGTLGPISPRCILGQEQMPTGTQVDL